MQNLTTVTLLKTTHAAVKNHAQKTGDKIPDIYQRAIASYLHLEQPPQQEVPQDQQEPTTTLLVNLTANERAILDIIKRFYGGTLSNHVRKAIALYNEHLRQN